MNKFSQLLLSDYPRYDSLKKILFKSTIVSSHFNEFGDVISDFKAGSFLWTDEPGLIWDQLPNHHDFS